MSLVDLVSRLARPHTEKIKVTDRATGMPEVVTHIRQPLLTELEECTTGPGGAGGQPGSKVIINGDALDLQGEIRGELIRDMLRIGHRIAVERLSDLLLHWHDAWAETAPTSGEEAAWVETLTDWETRIRAMIEPTKVMPVPGEPCPLCGDTRVQDGEDSTVALWIEFSEDSPEDTVRLVCRKCGPVVQGGGSKGVAALLRIAQKRVQ